MHLADHMTAVMGYIKSVMATILMIENFANYLEATTGNFCFSFIGTNQECSEL